MARKARGLIFDMPTPEQQRDDALAHAIDKAVMCHPQTQALRKQLAKDMAKAAKGTPAPRKRKA
jgi:hypothetical protein